MTESKSGRRKKKKAPGKKHASQSEKTQKTEETKEKDGPPMDPMLAQMAAMNPWMAFYMQQQ